MRVWILTYDDSRTAHVTRTGLSHYVSDLRLLRKVQTLAPGEQIICQNENLDVVDVDRNLTIECKDFPPNPITYTNAVGVITKVFKGVDLSDPEEDLIHGVTFIRFSVWKFPVLVGIGPRPGAVILSSIPDDRITVSETLDELQENLEDLRLYLVGVAASLLDMCGKAPPTTH